MNKTRAFALIVGLAVFGVVGAVVLLILAPESADKFIAMIVPLLITLGGFAGLTAQQAKQDEKLETIKTNTNGTLTKKDEQIDAYRAALAEVAPEALAALDTGAVIVTPAPRA